MYSPAIAEQLRRRGHDADAVTERPELRSLPDSDIFTVAQDEGRTVVTENIVDFLRAARSWEESGRIHHGLVLVDPSAYPRGLAATLGRMVLALDALVAGRSSSASRRSAGVSGSVCFLVDRDQL